jgi:hypothetical protein
MVLVLKRGATPGEIAELEKKLYHGKPTAGFDAKKFNGVLKLQEDPMVIQKKLRNDWERDFS